MNQFDVAYACVKGVQVFKILSVSWLLGGVSIGGRIDFVVVTPSAFYHEKNALNDSLDMKTELKAQGNNQRRFKIMHRFLKESKHLQRIKIIKKNLLLRLNVLYKIKA